MTDQPPLVIPRDALRRRLRASEQVLMVRRLKALGIHPWIYQRCTTMAPLKVIVKRQYRRLARRLHPDILGQRYAMVTTGKRFQKVARLHDWFMAQPDDVACNWIRRETLPDPPIPWNLDPWRKPITLPWGFHETRDYLAYQ